MNEHKVKKRTKRRRLSSRLHYTFHFPDTIETSFTDSSLARLRSGLCCVLQSNPCTQNETRLHLQDFAKDHKPFGDSFFFMQTFKNQSNLTGNIMSAARIYIQFVDRTCCRFVVLGTPHCLGLYTRRALETYFNRVFFTVLNR